MGSSSIESRSAHSFERIGIAHWDRFCRRALYLTRDVADAEDLGMDAYLLAYKQAHSQDGAPPSPVAVCLATPFCQAVR